VKVAVPTAWPHRSSQRLRAQEHFISVVMAPDYFLFVVMGRTVGSASTGGACRRHDPYRKCEKLLTEA
jgi:hypothetical protein